MYMICTHLQEYIVHTCRYRFIVQIHEIKFKFGILFFSFDSLLRLWPQFTSSKVSFLLISQSTAVGSTQSLWAKTTLPGFFFVSVGNGVPTYLEKNVSGAFAIILLYLIFLVGFQDHLVNGASKSWWFNPPKAMTPHGDAQHNVDKKKLTGMV